MVFSTTTQAAGKANDYQAHNANCISLQWKRTQSMRQIRAQKEQKLRAAFNWQPKHHTKQPAGQKGAKDDGHQQCPTRIEATRQTAAARRQSGGDEFHEWKSLVCAASSQRPSTRQSEKRLPPQPALRKKPESCFFLENGAHR
jgi:hypothetical protein